MGTIGEMDAPLPPAAKGYRATMWRLLGATTAVRQQYRDSVLSTSHEAFAAFAARLSHVTPRMRVAAFGSADAVKAASATHAPEGAEAAPREWDVKVL